MIAKPKQDDGWTALAIGRDTKRKFDEAARRTRFTLKVVADQAISHYLRLLEEAPDEAMRVAAPENE